MLLRSCCALCDPNTRTRKKTAIAAKIQNSTSRGHRDHTISTGVPPPSMFFLLKSSEDVRMGTVIFRKVRIRYSRIASKRSLIRVLRVVIVALMPLFMLDSKRYSHFAYRLR